MTRTFVPQPIIRNNFRRAEELSKQKWSPSWAGVLAAGLGGLGGVVHRSAANNALTDNQDMRADAIRGAGASPDNMTMAQTLMQSGVPGLDEYGLKSMVSARQKEADRLAKEKDPLRAAQIKLAQVRAAKVQRESTGGTADYGKTGTIFKHPNGKYYAARWASDGTQKIEEVRVGGTPLSPAKGITTVDTGTGTRILDKSTGLDVREIDKDLAGAEAAKTEGRIAATKRAELPEARKRLTLVTSGLDRMINTANALKTSKGLSRVTGGLWEAYAPNVSKRARNSGALLENIKVQISGNVLAAMKAASKTGGAVGQVTEAEWPRLENMIASLDPAQGESQFLEQLNVVVDYAKQVKSAMRLAYEQDVRLASGAEALPEQKNDPFAGFKIRKLGD